MSGYHFHLNILKLLSQQLVRAIDTLSTLMAIVTMAAFVAHQGGSVATVNTIKEGMNINLALYGACQAKTAAQFPWAAGALYDAWKAANLTNNVVQATLSQRNISWEEQWPGAPSMEDWEVPPGWEPPPGLVDIPPP